MKSIVIIGAWCNSSEKEEALINCIKEVKKEGLDVLVFTRLPLNQDIQKLCDYVIYDKTNPILYDRIVIMWHVIEDRKIRTSSKYDWGFAAMEQMVKSLGFVNSLEYEIAYWINYDIDVTNLNIFIKEAGSDLKDNDAFFFKWFCEDGINSFDMTAVGFNVNKCYLPMKKFITLENYRGYINKTDFIAENIFFYMIKESGIKFGKTQQLTYLPGKISNEGERALGNITEKFPKTYKYTERVFLGKHEDKFKVFLMFIKKPIFNISVYDGTSIKTLWVKDISRQYIEIEIDNPKQLKLISINNEEINETLDPFIEPNYFDTNIIESI